jgi:hypothetical protein
MARFGGSLTLRQGRLTFLSGEPSFWKVFLPSGDALRSLFSSEIISYDDMYGLNLKSTKQSVAVLFYKKMCQHWLLFYAAVAVTFSVMALLRLPVISFKYFKNILYHITMAGFPPSLIFTDLWYSERRHRKFQQYGYTVFPDFLTEKGLQVLMLFSNLFKLLRLNSHPSVPPRQGRRHLSIERCFDR